jgi:hypothetical protein
MLLGGVAGPLLFGALIQTGARENIFWGYLLGGGLMIFAAAVEAALGVSAKGGPWRMWRRRSPASGRRVQPTPGLPRYRRRGPD